MSFFFRKGVRHILTGWDHIFFVIGLILAATDLRNLVKVITAFTLAHSITLIITSLDIITVNKPQAVEAVIALSIAYVGLKNLIRNRTNIRSRWVVAFGFGLVHGMGFAGALKEQIGSSLPSTFTLLLICLVVFNLGVEAGQLTIISILYPALRGLRVRKASAFQKVFVVGSGLVFLMGISWFLDRSIMPEKLPWVF